MASKSQAELQNKTSSSKGKQPRLVKLDTQSPQSDGLQTDDLSQLTSAVQTQTLTPFTPPIDPSQRQHNFSHFRQISGNAVAARLAQTVRLKKAVRVQRHPEGAPLLGGAATDAGVNTNAVAIPAAGVQSAGGGSSPAADTTNAGGGGGGGPSAITTTDSGGGGGAAPAAGTGVTPASATGTPPIPVARPTLQVAFAQNALTTAFGSIASRPIISGTIHTVANLAALYGEYDRLCIRDRITNPDTGNVWATGDAERDDLAHGTRTNAFAYQGEIWLDVTQTDPTAMVHEMLHVNTAGDFRSTVGEVINEGTTQRLAVQAVTLSGNSVAGSENTYQREQAVVSALVAIVGEATLKSAYFNGASTLVSVYEGFFGSRSFAMLKRTLDGASNDATAFDRAVRLLQPPSIAQKIAMMEAVGDGTTQGVPRELVSQIESSWSTPDRIAICNSLLDGWVSDTDLDMIETTVQSVSGDRGAIAAALQPRIRTLWSIGQRTRLRVILGVV